MSEAVCVFLFVCLLVVMILVLCELNYFYESDLMALI